MLKNSSTSTSQTDDEVHFIYLQKTLLVEHMPTMQKYSNQLVNMLLIFVDKVLLHSGKLDSVFWAATKAFAIPNVLDHTTIIIFY